MHSSPVSVKYVRKVNQVLLVNQYRLQFKTLTVNQSWLQSVKDGSKQNKKPQNKLLTKQPKPLHTPESKLHIAGKSIFDSLHDKLH